MNTRPSRLLIVSCIILTSAVLTGQMSGNYTINPNGTGTRNFQSFGAAVFQLWKTGMGGAVTFVVEPGNYTKTWGIIPVTGMGNNPLTFRSRLEHQAVFTSPKDALLFDLSAGSVIQKVVLDGFRFAGRGTAIWARTRTRDVEIKNCLFDSTTGTGIYAQNANGWNIHHCKFHVYAALRLDDWGNSDVHHNHFTLKGSSGILVKKNWQQIVGSLRIYNNLFTGGGGTAVAASAAGAYGVEIVHNTFVVNTTGPCVTLTGLVSRPGKLLDNIIVNTGTGGIVGVVTISSFNVQLDGNIYHKPSTGTIIGFAGKGYNLAAWQKLSGQDPKSYEQDPNFASNTTFHLARLSIGRGNAVHTPLYVTDDFEGTKRRNPAAIGAYEGDPSTFELYGTGCAGSGGLIPKILHGGDLRVGGRFQMILSNALGGSNVPAALVIGATKQTIPLGGGCSLLVAPHLLVPLKMGGSQGQGQGIIVYWINVPNDPRLRGTQTHFQWAVGDPAAKGIGFAMSPGATITL